MNASFLRYDQDGAVVTITMSRPEQRNAIGSHADCDEFVAAIERASADPRIAVVVLTGDGPSFSAGGNLKNMRDRIGIGALATPMATRNNYRAGIQRVPRALWELEIPTIAAVNGHAIGVGLDLACMCDIRIAADSATFAASFIKVGIVPGDGGAYFLPKAVGLSKAAEMLFTGDMLDAEAALACGLVSHVVPAHALMAEAGKLAARIAANPPLTLRLSKRLLREAQHARLAEVLELSAAFQSLAHETADHRAALNAFFDKRAPIFTGQ
jgi:2-(1,2-epoxy-1,2-dihydrophenyl)acetyl-CoA isomerase